MDVIFVGAGHWHYPLYRNPLNTVKGVRITGIIDPDADVAARRAGPDDCPTETNLARFLDRARPDLAFVLGRHVDMPGNARTLIAAGVPFVLEKPGGTSPEVLQELAEAARAAGVYASVPLVFRSSGFMAAVREVLVDEPAIYAAFKFIAGLPDRYLQSGCGWMLNRELAGGGVLTNLGIHFFDLLREILGPDLALGRAEFARFAGLGNVEDFADVSVTAGDARGKVETGYLYPAPTGVFDMHFSIRTAGHYVTATGPGSIEITTLDGRQTRREATTTNMEIYPDYVRDVVRQVREGAPPIAGLDDLVPLTRMIADAYARGGMSPLGSDAGRSQT